MNDKAGHGQGSSDAPTTTPEGARELTHADDTLRHAEPAADADIVVTPAGVTEATDVDAPAEAHEPLNTQPAAGTQTIAVAAPAPINAATGKPQETGIKDEFVVEADGRQASDGDGIRRRDFIHTAALSFAGVGGLAVVTPLVIQMSPAADVRALSSTEIDVSAIQPGQAIKTSWRKQPVFVRNLTPAEIEAANKVPAGELRDQQSLADRTKPDKQNWLITLGVCTHLGCVPLGAAEGEAKGDFGGYFCPCHGSHYDTAGRIRKGPAPTNLEVPPYTFTSDTLVTIG